MNIMVVGKLTDIHHYAWLNSKDLKLQKGMDAYFIYPSNYYDRRVKIKKLFPPCG